MYYFYGFTLMFWQTMTLWDRNEKTALQSNNKEKRNQQLTKFLNKIKWWIVGWEELHQHPLVGHKPLPDDAGVMETGSMSLAFSDSSSVLPCYSSTKPHSSSFSSLLSKSLFFHWQKCNVVVFWLYILHTCQLMVHEMLLLPTDHWLI